MSAFVFDPTCASPCATSYVTVDEADSYIALFYPESRWLNLADDPERAVAIKKALLSTATKMIDSLPIYGKKLLDSITPYSQALKFPIVGHPLISSIVEASYQTENYTEIFSSGVRYRADATKQALLGGSVLICSGIHKGAIKRIVDYDESTKKIVCERFAEALPVGTFVYIIFPVPKPIIAACCEQARHLLEGLGSQAVELAYVGIKSLGTLEGSVNLDYKGIYALLSPVALVQIRPYLQNFVEIARG